GVGRGGQAIPLGRSAMLTNLFRPTMLAPLVLRLGLAVCILTHGLMKILGPGATRWSGLNMPSTTQFLIAWGEVVAGVALVLGLLTRLAALGVLIIQIGAIAYVTGQWGFINLSALKAGTLPYRFERVGWEYNFAIIVMALTLIITGGGALSVGD